MKYPHETIIKSLKNDNKIYWLNEKLELSRYYGFDTQWIKINRKWINMPKLFDIINNIPVAYQISKKETQKSIENFIKKSIPIKKQESNNNGLKRRL